MTAARFTVALYHTEYIKARVTHSVRRVDLDRAVFHAQMWLLRTQSLAVYCGITYNAWSVSSTGADDIDAVLAKGGVADATQARLPSSDARRRVKMDAGRKNGASNGAKNPRGTRHKNDPEGLGYTVSAPKKTRKIIAREPTYFQRRMLEMREIAQRANAVQ